MSRNKSGEAARAVARVSVRRKPPRFDAAQLPGDRPSDCVGDRRKTLLFVAMRKFLSSTAGATFNQEVATQTICVRKDCVELIYKVKPSVYVVVSMVHVSDGEGMLFVNWAHYFDRFPN